jgi:hypothetical protein
VAVHEPDHGVDSGVLQPSCMHLCWLCLLALRITCAVLVLSTTLQAKKWRAYFSFPRCVRDLFSNTLLLVGLPPQLRQNEGALRAALSRYGTVASLQVCQLLQCTANATCDFSNRVFASAAFCTCCGTKSRSCRKSLLSVQCVDCTNNMVALVSEAFLTCVLTCVCSVACAGVSPRWAQPPGQ